MVSHKAKCLKCGRNSMLIRCGYEWTCFIDCDYQKSQDIIKHIDNMIKEEL